MVYVLYKNKNGEVEIGIPDMVEYFPSTANMFGFGEATEKAFFYNGGSSLIESAPTINDRPICDNVTNFQFTCIFYGI